MFLFNYSGSDVDMELKKSFFLNIQGQGQLTMLKYEDILAWINTSIDYSISCPL
jgi:cell division GTPase FtsZ